MKYFLSTNTKFNTSFFLYKLKGSYWSIFQWWNCFKMLQHQGAAWKAPKSNRGKSFDSLSSWTKRLSPYWSCQGSISYSFLYMIFLFPISAFSLWPETFLYLIIIMNNQAMFVDFGLAKERGGGCYLRLNFFSCILEQSPLSFLFVTTFIILLPQAFYGFNFWPLVINITVWKI